MKRFSLSKVKRLPVLHQGHFDNLIWVNFNTHSPFRNVGDTKVWVSRCTVADGMPYNNQVTVEMWDGNKWEIVDQYEPM